MGLLASCNDIGQNKSHEIEIADTLNQETPSEPEDLYPELPYAEDTVWYENYVFASYPIPDTVKARMQGKSMKDNARIGYDQLRYLILPYYDFDGNIQKGEMVCNQSIAHDLLCIFKALFSKEYPICSIRLVDDFDADDEASMEANNTSCFNYRTVPGSN